MVQHIHRYGSHPNVRRYASMLLVSNAKAIPDVRSGRMKDNALGA